ncbi:ATP-binding protein [Bradyrhizobium elkanii]|uniref:ATP-binding protein n=1 Tax=Bradyrhizobium elkanii TaxID=29448 RepID=UPI0003F7D719|nr:ATP-binding protein [Bradyrhizobium elkanii]
MKIISASERLQEDKGVKALIVGPAGVGKTSLLRTLNPDNTLFVDLEAGDLAVQDVAVDSVRPDTWEACRDLACYLGGPNPALPDTACYSREHYREVLNTFGSTNTLAKYHTYFIDSITVAGRLCFRWCEQQPESFNERGKKNVLGTYGLMGREMVNWLVHLQHARDRNVIFLGLLEKELDDFKMVHWELQIEGSKTGKELPGIVDQIITMQFIDFGDGNPVRAFVCTQPNPWGYPAKDRAGRLEQIEEPHLGKLLSKLTANTPRKPLDHTLSPATETQAA